MAELKMDRENVHDGKKWGNNVMKRSPLLSENGL